MTIREITDFLTQIPPTKKLTQIEQEYTFNRLIEPPSNQMEMNIQQELYAYPMETEQLEPYITNPHNEYDSDESDQELLGPELWGKEPNELMRKLSPLEFRGILKNKSPIVHKGENIPHNRIQKKVTFVSTWLSPLDELKEQRLPELRKEPIEEKIVEEEMQHNLLEQMSEYQEQKTDINKEPESDRDTDNMEPSLNIDQEIEINKETEINT